MIVSRLFPSVFAPLLGRTNLLGIHSVFFCCFCLPRDVATLSGSMLCSPCRGVRTYPEKSHQHSDRLSHPALRVMLITKELHTVSASFGPSKNIGIYVISPSVPGYPQAKFPGVVVFRWAFDLVPRVGIKTCGSEIYQVTGPVERFAGQIASQGYVVGSRSGRASAHKVSSITSSMSLKLPRV